MMLIPAIDLLHGDVVRLRHGDFSDSTPYDVPAEKLARKYFDAGAEWLHVVDLVASRDGEAADPEPLFRLIEAAPQYVQTGGGVRAGEDIRTRLDHGTDRVVVGTLCVTQTPRFVGWLKEFGSDHLVSALDVSHDEAGMPRLRTHGWTESSDRDLWQLLDLLASAGLKHLLCTDIGKDGTLRGPNFDLYRELASRYPALHIQASGGVAGLRDLQDLADTGVSAAIAGKALLEGCFTVEEALEVLK